MVELVSGAALGALAGQVLKVILKLGEKAINFNPVLDDFKSNINAIIPLVNQIDDPDRNQHREVMEKLKNELEEAKRLIEQCKDLHYLKRPRYTGKLRKLDSRLKSSLQLLQLQIAVQHQQDFKTLKNITSQILRRLDLIQDRRLQPLSQLFFFAAFPCFCVLAIAVLQTLFRSTH